MSVAVSRISRVARCTSAADRVGMRVSVTRGEGGGEGNLMSSVKTIAGSVAKRVRPGGVCVTQQVSVRCHELGGQVWRSVHTCTGVAGVRCHSSGTV